MTSITFAIDWKIWCFPTLNCDRSWPKVFIKNWSFDEIYSWYYILDMCGAFAPPDPAYCFILMILSARSLEDGVALYCPTSSVLRKFSKALLSKWRIFNARFLRSSLIADFWKRLYPWNAYTVICLTPDTKHISYMCVCVCVRACVCDRHQDALTWRLTRPLIFSFMSAWISCSTMSREDRVLRWRFWTALCTILTREGTKGHATCWATFSKSDELSYRKISWSLEAARLTVWMIGLFWNLTGTSAAVLPMRLSNFRAIKKF